MDVNINECRRPIELQDFRLSLKNVPLEELQSIKEQTSLSLHRLLESNKLMMALLAREVRNNKKKNSQEGNNEDTSIHEDEVDLEEFGPVGSDDVKIYKESVHENEIVINNHKERIAALDAEIANRSATPNASSVKLSDLNAPADNTSSTDNDYIDTTASNGVYI